MWDDIIAEPEGIESGDCTWRTSYKCFYATKHCCYRLLACILGPLIACCLGCQFACLAFQVSGRPGSDSCATTHFSHANWALHR